MWFSVKSTRLDYERSGNWACNLKHKSTLTKPLIPNFKRFQDHSCITRVLVYPKPSTKHFKRKSEIAPNQVTIILLTNNTQMQQICYQSKKYKSDAPIDSVFIYIREVCVLSLHIKQLPIMIVRDRLVNKKIKKKLIDLQNEWMNCVWKMMNFLHP